MRRAPAAAFLSSCARNVVVQNGQGVSALFAGRAVPGNQGIAPDVDVTFASITGNVQAVLSDTAGLIDAVTVPPAGMDQSVVRHLPAC